MHWTSEAKRVSSILIDGTYRVTSVKVVNASLNDSARIPEDAIWHVFDFRTRASSYVRLHGGVDELTVLLNILSTKAEKTSMQRFESSSLSLKDDDGRVEEEDIPAAFPLAHKTSVNENPTWRALLAVCLSFHPHTREVFAIGLLECGFGDAVVRWLFSGDDTALKKLCEERDVLQTARKCGPSDEALVDAITAFAAMARVPTVSITLKRRKNGSVKVVNERGELFSDKKSLLLLACEDQPPDDVFVYDDREFRLVSPLTSVRCTVKVGSMTWVEAGRSGVDPVLHCDVDKVNWLADLRRRVLFTGETTREGGNAKFAFVES